jgi:hypothetical protein
MDPADLFRGRSLVEILPEGDELVDDPCSRRLISAQFTSVPFATIGGAVDLSAEGLDLKMASNSSTLSIASSLPPAEEAVHAT